MTGNTNTDNQHPLFQQAMALHQAGKLTEAFALYKTLLPVFPKNTQLLSLLGAIALQLGDFEACIRFNRQSLGIAPDQSFAWFYLGAALKQLQRFDEALEGYDRAIALNPRHAETWCNRGNILQALKRSAEALSSFDRAIAIKPAFALAHFNRSNLLRDLKQFDAAVAGYQHTLACKPDMADAWCNLGTTYKDLKHFAEAIACYDRAYALKPDYAFLAGQRLFTRLLSCDWDNIDQEIRGVCLEISRGRNMALPFQAQGFCSDPAILQQAAASWVAEKCPPQPAKQSLPADQHDRIRLGYFSADFRVHPVAYLTARLFELHNREKFELFGFYFGSDNDDMTDRLRSGFEHFIDIHAMSDREVVALAARLEIDIAVDLGGHTQDSRTELFAMRIAPLQVNFLGYPGSMGAGYMDYLLADRTVIPERHQPFYTEKIVYLPHSYLVNDNTQPIAEQVFSREDCQLPANGVVFCCFNNSYKLNPAMFACWMRILAAVADSVLWLSVDHPQVQETLRREARQRGIADHRLIFAGRMPNMADHLARLRVADLFLDTLPYNAHTTASDALWAGLPVLTCLGESFAGRVAASLLNALNLPELISHNPGEYEALAIELAQNPDKLAAIRQRVAENRLTAALFDTERYSRHLEAAYETMLERHRAGLPPATIYALEYGATGRLG